MEIWLITNDNRKSREVFEKNFFEVRVRTYFVLKVKQLASLQNNRNPKCNG